jgi:hypothetical protein
MIQVCVRAFHLDTMPRCTHNRVTCTACGLDPFAHPAPQHSQGDNAPGYCAEGLGAFHDHSDSTGRRNDHA